MRDVSSLKHLDLFSGLGGFSLGLEATGGFETVAFCDIEKFPRKVLKQHWPDVKQYKDIKELTYERLQKDGIGEIDIITGGYPCQPFSVAGRQRGEKDKRHLWPEMFRLIHECRPTWVIGENVSGHIKLGLDTVLEDLESEGYAARAFSISASSVGATHKRERVWIVGNSQHNGSSTTEKSRSIEETSNDNKERPNQTSESTGTSRSNSNENVENTRQPGWGEQSTWNTESFGRGSSETTEWSTDTDTSSGSSEGAETMSDSNSKRLEGRRSEQQLRKDETERKISWDGWWEFEPDVGRVANGVPKRVDRLKGLGNSLVPAIPFIIGQSILREEYIW